MGDRDSLRQCLHEHGQDLPDRNLRGKHRNERFKIKPANGKRLFLGSNQFTGTAIGWILTGGKRLCKTRYYRGVPIDWLNPPSSSTSN